MAVVGVATQGGRFPPAWRDLLKASIAAGLDVESGLHEFISDDPELAELARERRGRAARPAQAARRAERPDGREPRGRRDDRADGRLRLRDRKEDGRGRARPRSAAARARRRCSCPTGQTGIAIAGWGIAVDAVVSDFLAGAAEWLVVEGARRGGKLLFVEGQGSLVHPMYSGVTLGLVHGAVPHAFVLCHAAGSTEIEGCPGHPIPPLTELVELHERIALPARKAKVACVALNTAAFAERRGRAARDRRGRGGNGASRGRSRPLRRAASA